MSSPISPARRSGSLTPTAAMTGVLLLATAVGAVYPVTALRLSPLLMPAAIALAIAMVVAYQRPEIAIAVALIIIPADTLGFPHKLSVGFVEAWSVYVTTVAYVKDRAVGGRASWPAVGTAIAAFLAIVLLSFTQASDLHASVHEFAQLSCGALLFAASYLSVRSRRDLTWLLGGVTAGAGIVGLHALGQYVSGGSLAIGFVTSGGEVVGRVAAGFDSPNHLAGFLVVCVPLAIAGAAVARRGKPLFALAAFVAAVGVYASLSRGALIALVLVPFVFLSGWRLWLLGPALLLVTVLAAPGVVKERFATLSSSTAEISTRADIWNTALNIWESHPILGVGVAGFPSAYTNAPVPGKLFSPNSVFKPPPHAHNIVLETLAEEGILGLLTFLAVIATTVRGALRLRAGPGNMYRIAGSGFLAALLAFLVHNMFDVTLVDQHTSWYLFILLGMIAGAQRIFPVEPADSVGPAH